MKLGLTKHTGLTAWQEIVLYIFEQYQVLDHINSMFTLPYHKLHQKLANSHNKGSIELYCLFIADDRMNDTISFIRGIVV